MSKRRNWRQRWDPNADLVFCRRMRIGDNPKKPFALPGDKVTKRIREKIGPRRLRLWFETGAVELANWTPPEPQRILALRAAAEKEIELRTNAAALRESLG